MVSSSIPVFLDPPSWQHEQPNQLLGGGNGQQTGLQLPPLPPPAGGQPRPGSMAERARHAKIPQPEAALKCPRCESTNTKFCYYNNYSLSQPRHFCKMCRRYWTRGGALRNVPVGGGCRKNRRSKGRGGSKSQVTAATAGPSSTASPGGALPPPPLPAPSQLPFLPPLQSLSDYGDLEFQAGTANGGGGGEQVMVPNGLLFGEQWRVQHQFPFLANLGTTQAGGLFQFHQGDEGTGSDQGLNLMSRNLLGLSESYNHQPSWDENNGNNAWTGNSGLASSSISSHHQ